MAGDAPLCQNCGGPIAHPRRVPSQFGHFCTKRECKNAYQRAVYAARGKPRPPRNCWWCGNPIPETRGTHVTCSVDCDQERKRANARDYYRREAVANPDRGRQQYARLKARAEADPEYAARLNELVREKVQRAQERFETDPEYREHVRQRARARLAANRERVRAQWNEAMAKRLAAMTPEERAEYEGNRLRYIREWKRNHRAEHQLAELQRVGTELERRLNE